MPRKCGIATFMTDILGAVAATHSETQCMAVAINDIPGGYDYPALVRCEIEEQNLSSYLRAADFLNNNDVEVVSLQHEFGIFGGVAGGHVLALLRELKMPVVTTLHTILLNPSPDQRRLMDGVVGLSSRVIVMAARGQRMLQEIYNVPAEKIDLIPHGIPDGEFVDPDTLKAQFGVEGRTVLLTFGLLSPNKGIEYVLNALPRIVAEFPDVVYIVLGATHPNELREHGEAYRLSLEILAKKNGVDRNVIFHNHFVDLETLTEFIGAADLYITPYLNEAQITSGTLAYAFGSGNVVVSTPYWHAAELLDDGLGVLVPFADASAMAREVAGLLRDDVRRQKMRATAWSVGRRMVWSNVARMYMESFERSREENLPRVRKSIVSKTLDRKPRELPTMNLGHLGVMLDSAGIFQHATYSVPNFSEGYCVDDNARAFILSALLGELGADAERIRPLASTTMAFLNHAWNPSRGRFHNFMGFDRHWLDNHGSEDSHGRALWALGMAVGRSQFTEIQRVGAQLFAAGLPALGQFTSPRSLAFGLLGIHEFLRRPIGDAPAVPMRTALMDRLMDWFSRSAQPEWDWFEDSLAYDNAKLSHALIQSGQASGNSAVVECGLRSLQWLTDVQTSELGHFRPIGSNGFHARGGPRAHFDQQPIEAHATVSACLEAWRATKDVRWYEKAQRAFDWFLGWNDVGLELYCPETGGCRDGLHADRVNENQGAESTLAFLLSLAEMRQSQNVLTSFNEPTAGD
jgi:glycosyltransferase involved in cell wall biosynthesis